VIFITGASGFVGSALCAALRKQERPFYGVSRTRPYWAACSEEEAFFQLDLLSTSSIDLKEKLSGVKTIVHCAARAHIMHETEQDPERAFQALNVNVTQRLLEAAVAAGVKRFIFVSSVGVNGEKTPDNIPFHEHMPPHPKAPYAHSKWQAEQVIQGYASKIETVILRPPLIYGPFARGNFAALFRAIQARLPLPLASIKNKRSFLFLENMISALIACIDHPKAAGETFLVSDTEALSTPELIATLAKGVGHSAFLWPCPMPALHLVGVLFRKQESIRRLTDSLVIDARKIGNLLQWHPPYTAAKGLEKTGRNYVLCQKAL
jgi:nucleoside-diphosphate-sugar epimerase